MSIKNGSLLLEMYVVKINRQCNRLLLTTMAMCQMYDIISKNLRLKIIIWTTQSPIAKFTIIGKDMTI